MKTTPESAPAETSASAFAPLRHKVFLAIWLASIVSSIGTQMQQVGAAWLMTSLAPSPQLIALVTTAASLPALLFALPAGALADIVGKRIVLLVAQTLMFVASSVLAVAAYAEQVTPMLLLFLTFMVGTGTALMAPAWQSIVADLLPRKEIPRGVALNIAAFNLARTIGPAIAGVVVAFAGSKANFALNALSYLGMFAVLLPWKPEHPTGKFAAATVLGAMHDGVLYAFHTTPVRRAMIRVLLFAFCMSVVLALMPLVAKSLLNKGPEIYGLLLGCMGVGAVVMALQVNWLRAKVPVETLLRVSIALSSVGLMTIGFSRQLPLTCVAMFLYGAAQMFAMSNFNVSVQISVPRWVSARAVGLYQTGIFGGMTLGAWFWGFLAERVGVSLAYPISAGLLFSTLLLALKMPIREVEAGLIEPAPLADGWQMPDGPDDVAVVVSIEHRVPSEKQGQFIQLMAERQRMRLRDGARKVTWLQDAEDRTRFIERFQVRSREEYMLQRERRTVEAKHLDDQLAECNAPRNLPQMHYYFERRARPGGSDIVPQYPLG